ncbi:hypothetical protein [Pseudodesulfovibrio sediminis]|uniref:hypothetical protein n=1 Tax=Pseudodesulfovibrio sediminis TaxID=2810563 RepID=UPI001E36E3D6|nr:hypothetical protein [Pseudodesulfovibrio sediminis]
MNKTTNLNTLSQEHQKVQSKYEFMVKHKKELIKELAEKEKALTSLRNNREGLKTISADDLDLNEADENEKVSRYLISQGKITMEQNEKVLKKMDVLKLDYLGVCLALGLIDIKTGKQAIKANKVHSRSK